MMTEDDLVFSFLSTLFKSYWDDERVVMKTVQRRAKQIEKTSAYSRIQTLGLVIWPRGYKTFFMLSSAEHEIFSANKYENVINSWHFHIY